MAQPSDTRESALEPGADYDSYRIEALLGTGGMASVYRVRHRELGSLHALKVLHHAWPALRQRPLAEGRAQAGLRHANIVAVTETIDVEGRPGLVMDLIEGPPLKELMARGRLDWDAVDTLAQGILRGVMAAHKKGVVHRDLKPSNVLVQDDEGHYIPKVADFGIAKLLEEEPTAGGFQTRTGVAMGTPAYMAPEQVRNAKGVDHRADIWSLGVILYELVTGTTAFPQQDRLSACNAVCAGAHPPVRSAREGIPERMAAAIDAALVVDRDARVADCDTLLAIWRGRVSAPAALPSVVSAKSTFVGFEDDDVEPSLVPRNTAAPLPAPPPAVRAAARVGAPQGKARATAMDLPAPTPVPATVPQAPRGRALPLVLAGTVVVLAVVWATMRPGDAPEPPPSAPNATTTAPTPHNSTTTAPTPHVAPTSIPPATEPAKPPDGLSDTLEVSLKSYPLGATVKLFDKAVCTTPCKARLPVGSHLAEFSLPDGRTSQVVVNVSPTQREFGHRFP